MASEVTKLLWEHNLIEELKELSERKFDLGIVLASEAVDDFIESLEEESSKEDVDFAKFKDCPKCGDARQPNTNFCSRCGYETGQCKHENYAYHQNGRVFCLKCKKKLRYVQQTESKQQIPNEVKHD